LVTIYIEEWIKLSKNREVGSNIQLNIRQSQRRAISASLLSPSLRLGREIPDRSSGVYPYRSSRDAIRTSPYFLAREIHGGSHNSMEETEEPGRGRREEAKWTAVTAREPRHSDASVMRERARLKGSGKKSEGTSFTIAVAFNRMTFMRKFFRCRTTTFFRNIICSAGGETALSKRKRRCLCRI